MTAISNSVRYAELVLQSPPLPKEVRRTFPECSCLVHVDIEV